MNYYGNRLKKEYKDKYASLLSEKTGSLLTFSFRDPKHVEWVNLCIALVESMKTYAKEYHPTGASWDSKVVFSPQYPQPS